MIAKKALLVTGISAVVGLASVGGVVSAATTGSNETAAPTGHSLIDKLAAHFNLDKNEVEKVFAEHHEEKRANLGAKIEEKLAKAVEAGYITEAQKTAILEKHQELKDYRQSINDKPIEERRELMKAKHEELRKWAEENGLKKFAHFLHGFGHGKMIIKDGQGGDEKILFEQ